MTSLTFNGSATPSIGMELELQLIHPETYELVDGILPLLEAFPQASFIQPEMNQATVEIASAVCKTVPELEVDTRSMLRQLKADCQSLGMTLCAAGTHPCFDRPAAITPIPRYLAQQEAAGYLAEQMMTFALQVHVGVPSGEAAIALMNRLRPYLPLLLALSASSPFWQGHDTGFASFRQRFLAILRSYGLPPKFHSWQEFERFYAFAQTSGMLHSIRDVHWDLRPQPGLGTVEVRIMDAQPTLQEAMMLAALVHGLGVSLLQAQEASCDNLFPEPQPYWLERENYYQASRLGLDAGYLWDLSGKRRTIRQIIPHLLEAIAPAAQALGELDYLEQINDRLMRGGSYSRQRQVWQATGSWQAVVAALAHELESSLVPDISHQSPMEWSPTSC